MYGLNIFIWKKKKVMAGSKVKIWKQDPSVLNIGIRSSYISTEVQNGPADSDIILQGIVMLTVALGVSIILYERRREK